MWLTPEVAGLAGDPVQAFPMMSEAELRARAARPLPSQNPARQEPGRDLSKTKKQGLQA